MPKSWSKPYLSILRENASLWIEADGKVERMGAIENVANKIVTQIEKDDDDRIENLQDKVLNWYNNNIAKKNMDKPPTTKSYSKRVVTVRDVITRTHQDKIHALVATKTKDKVGQGNWIGFYPAALNQVLAGLTKKEREQAEREAEEWTETGAPREVQRQKAEKFLARDVNAFLKDMSLQLGVQLFVMAGYEKSDGTISTTKFQTTPRRGDAFVDAEPDWRTGTWEKWSEYLEGQYNDNYQLGEDATDSIKPSRKDPVAEIPRHEELGWPLIPRQSDKTLQESKSVLRAYVTATYRHYTNNKVAVVPWTALSTDVNFEYVSSESLPNGQFLLDPSKLQQHQIFKIWRNWSERQDADTQGLVFQKALDRDVRNVDSTAGPSKDPTYKYVKPSDLGPKDALGLDGLDKCPHLESPAAHAASKMSKMSYLRTLSTDLIYISFVDLLDSQDEPEDGMVETSAENLPHWGSWEWEDKFLPEEFHTKPSIFEMHKLASENWLDMGSDAELVVLSMGLALRDMSAVQFVEEDNFPEDFPDWVKSSPLNITDGEGIMNIWREQLPAEKNFVGDPDPKGKGKANNSRPQKKRKAVPLVDDSPPEEWKPKPKRGKPNNKQVAGSTTNGSDGRKLRSRKKGGK